MPVGATGATSCVAHLRETPAVVAAASAVLTPPDRSLSPTAGRGSVSRPFDGSHQGAGMPNLAVLVARGAAATHHGGAKRARVEPARRSRPRQGRPR